MEKPLKVVIAGEKHVGKSSLVHRFIHQQFPLKDLYSTVGFDFTVKNLTLEDGSNVTLHLFDFGGEPSFRMIFPQYASDNDGLILAFDPSREETFDALHEWIRVYKQRKHEKESVNFLVSTKSDLGVSPSPLKINDFRNQYPIDQYFQTSAVTGENAQLVFQKMVEAIRKKHRKR
ncbi:MAG: GTP-binding protein [Candidatus Heimdallarchaeota archaeon]|nr:MAG: GTP-binding protein [Candidatus Heimdallarchaeota archaeon]